jgi:hypothetical protein
MRSVPADRSLTPDILLTRETGLLPDWYHYQSPSPDEAGQAKPEYPVVMTESPDSPVDMLITESSLVAVVRTTDMVQKRRILRTYPAGPDRDKLPVPGVLPGSVGRS